MGKRRKDESWNKTICLVGFFLLVFVVNTAVLINGMSDSEPVGLGVDSKFKGTEKQATPQTMSHLAKSQPPSVSVISLTPPPTLNPSSKPNLQIGAIQVGGSIKLMRMVKAGLVTIADDKKTDFYAEENNQKEKQKIVTAHQLKMASLSAEETIKEEERVKAELTNMELTKEKLVQEAALAEEIVQKFEEQKKLKKVKKGNSFEKFKETMQKKYDYMWVDEGKTSGFARYKDGKKWIELDEEFKPKAYNFQQTEFTGNDRATTKITFKDLDRQGLRIQVQAKEVKFTDEGEPDDAPLRLLGGGDWLLFDGSVDVQHVVDSDVSKIDSSNFQQKEGVQFEKMSLDWEWMDPARDVAFGRVTSTESQKYWIEFGESPLVSRFFYQELSVDETYENGPLVMLRDLNRGMYIKLDDYEGHYKYKKEDEWIKMNEGRYFKINGKKSAADAAEANDMPPPAFTEKELTSVKVYVGLAAFRETLCGNSLREMFKYAKYPDRVYAGVVQQKLESDPDCLADYCSLEPNCRRDQVSVTTVPLQLSRGVMPARFRQHLMVKDEDFCMQVDSHSAFEDDWDMIALTSWRQTNNEMAVLSTYPNTVKDRHDQKNCPARCSTVFSGIGRTAIVCGGNSAHNVPPGKTPYLVPFYGAGVSFSRCHADVNVPYDLYMSHLFTGEEFNRAARLYTWGYDVYAPNKNWVYHYYHGDNTGLSVELANGRTAPKEPYHDDGGNAYQGHLYDETVRRWRLMLGLEPNGLPTAVSMQDAHLFGFGPRRTLAQYLSFAGVDLVNLKTISRCDKLGRLKRTPYKFEKPFRPAGPKGCPDPYHKCCTTLSRIRKRAEEFLALSNKQLGQALLSSKDKGEQWDYDGELYKPNHPIVSAHTTGTGNFLDCSGNYPEDGKLLFATAV